MKSIRLKSLIRTCNLLLTSKSIKRFGSLFLTISAIVLLPNYLDKSILAYDCNDPGRCCESDGVHFYCGPCCDYGQCQFADPSRCEGDDPGGGPGGNNCDNTYNVRLYIRKDANHNGNNDAFENDPPLSGSISGVPGSIYCNGYDTEHPPFEYWDNWIFDTSNPEEYARVMTWRPIASEWTYEMTFRHPDAVYLGMGDLRHRCEARPGGGSRNIGYARSFFGRSTAGNRGRKALHMKVELLDIPLPGNNPYRFGRTFFGDYDNTPEGIGCSLMEDGWLGEPNTDRKRWYACGPTRINLDPVQCASREQVYTRNWIDVMVDNQDVVPVCSYNYCAPTNQVSVEPPISFNVTSEFAFTALVPGSNVRFISQDPDVFDLDADPLNVLPQRDVVATQGGYVGYYSNSVPIYASTNASSCGRSTRITTQFLNSGGVPVCSCETADLTLTCAPLPPPWYQFFGGDAISVNGDIASEVPVDPAPGLEFVSSDNLGIPIFSGQINPPTTVANIGDPGWKVQSSFKGHLTADSGMYDVSYFREKFYPAEDNVENLTIPSPHSTWSDYASNHPGQDYGGYSVYRQDGSLTIVPGSTDETALDLRGNGQQKVIIFVAGDLAIDRKIRLDDGIDFLMFVVEGNINVRPEVGDPAPYVNSGNPDEADIEGIYVTNGQFITNANNSIKDNQLYVRGIVSSFYNGAETNSVDMADQRDLGADNATFPAEIFQFAPDQLMLFPPFYSEKSITWKEVAL